jgi:putative mRNA 3-end processing factor
MNITFLGGSGEIGSTSLLLETEDFKCVFDYGMTPSSPPGFPLEAPALDYIFLSHAHLDHSGMIPALTRKNSVPFFTSQMTFLLSQILLRDNVKISEIEGYTIPYSKVDLHTLGENLYPVANGSQFSLKNAEFYTYSAGHIPGSVMFEVEFKTGQKLLYTGDLNTIDTRLVSGTKGKKCDILALETTYAGTDHELRQKIEYNFLEKAKAVIEGGGKVIIPVFAVGRTQEILLVLEDLVDDYDIWLDGLGKDVTKLFFKEPGFVSNDRKLKKLYMKIHKVRTKVHRKKALSGDIILTTSGMLDGGPVLNYINELKDNPKNAILLTGYQVEGSNGRRLLEKKQLNIYGTVEEIKLDVQQFDFSAHAGHKELVDFTRRCNPEHLILFHGEDREVLAQEFGDDYQVHLPKTGEKLEL